METFVDTRLESTAAPSVGPSRNLLELITLVPDSGVTKLAQELLIQTMHWAMAQNPRTTNWLERLLGTKPPAIDEEQQKIARHSLGWYQNVLARAITTHSLQSYAGPNAPAVRLTDD